ncbi:MAG TPA: site-specific DNA-methyltransferase [Phycisphaerae bacterium]|nr:site-specific DNA-methyltransferase [Phycisphaerae bacterium]
MPHLVAMALQADGWILRQTIIWHKPNPMPESCRDRPTKAHEYLFLLTKRPRYFYDQDAIRTAPRQLMATDSAGIFHDHTDDSVVGQRIAVKVSHPSGCNARSVWTIPTHAYPAAHFATFPPKLAERCILAGTSEKGCCPQCGAPWTRVVDKSRKPTRAGNKSKIYRKHDADDSPYAGKRDCSVVGNRDPRRHVTETQTVGWESGCDCGGEPTSCVVLDPFFGAGTTGLVAKRLGRDFIGIELNPEYARMSLDRINGEFPLWPCRVITEATDEGEAR